MHARYLHDWRYVLTGTSLTAWLIIPFADALRLVLILERSLTLRLSSLPVSGRSGSRPRTFHAAATSDARHRHCDSCRAVVERPTSAREGPSRTQARGLARHRAGNGLIGSEVMSATVDVWRWRARFRLARGQTITDATARIPAIESGLGTFREAVRIEPTPDDLANRFELRYSTPTRTRTPFRGLARLPSR